MITQKQIAKVVDLQKELFGKNDSFPREGLDKLKSADNFATIVTGLRRCGKSTFLHQFLRRQQTDFFHLNFEDTRLAGFEINDFTRLSDEIRKRNINTLFFDEIQLVKGWEMFIHQKLNEGYRAYITGSNASLLSKEMGTHLTGRHLSSELFPFSYKEFVGFKKREYNAESLKEYMFSGGIPEYLKTGISEILNYLMDDILIRDIAVRYGIRDVRALRQLAVYLVSNIGTLVSANKLAGMFGIKAGSTILEYFYYFKDSYLLDFLPMFSYSLKTQTRNLKKIYAVDMGIYSQNSTTFSDNSGRRLENTVYLHLRRQFKELYYFKEKNECDFVAMEHGNVKQLVQVCYFVDNMNFKREYEGLKEAMNYFGVKTGVIVTFNQQDRFEENGLTIQLIPAHRYLSE
jgi:predicted AAA+ superfamily ATPase